MAAKKRVIVAAFAALLILFGAALQAAVSSFTGPLSDLPYYVGAPQPYSYILDTNTTHYFAFNGTTGYNTLTSTNASEVIETVIAADTQLYFRAGTYPINYLLTINVENLAFIGEVVEGVVFDMGANGGFYFSHGSDDREHYRFENIYFDGANSNTPAFNNSGLLSDKRVGQARFINCRWQGWARGEATAENYAIDFRGYDYLVWEHCYFVNAPLRFRTTEHESGNSIIKDSVLMTLSGWTGFHMLYFETESGSQSEMGHFTSQNNQYLAATTNATVAIILNASNGDIKSFRSINDRTEACLLLEAHSNVTTAYVTNLQIAELSQSSTPSKNDIISVWLDTGVKRAIIHHCYLSASGDTNQTAIWDMGAGTSNDRNIIEFNTFNGYSNTNDEPIRFDPTKYTIIRYNTGFVTENMGRTTVADGEWFTHGLDESLGITKVNATGGITVVTDIYDGVPVICSIDGNINGTKIQVAVYWVNGTAITDDAIEIWWWLQYDPWPS